MNKIRITAFAGSSSKNSINRQLVNFTLSQFKDVQIELLDLNDFEMPIFSVDREKDGYPEQAHRFRKYMENSDGIICSMAEHNRTYTVAFKNILDWCSRIDMNVFAGKPMLLMSTSNGGYGGGNVMNAAKSFFPRAGANVVETFSLPAFKDNLVNDDMVDSALKQELFSKIDTFKSVLKSDSQG